LTFFIDNIWLTTNFKDDLANFVGLRNVLLHCQRVLFLGQANPELEEAIQQLLSIWDDNSELDSTRLSADVVDQNSTSTLIKRAWSLHEACILGDVESTTTLIENGADINAPDFDGRTPLMLALFHRKFKCASELLDAGCDLNTRERVCGHQALAYALNGEVSREWLQILQKMIPKAIQGWKSNPQRTPVYYLADCTSIDERLDEVLQLLLDAGVDIDAKNEAGTTAVVYCVTRNNAAAFRCISAAGACLTSLTSSHWSILHHGALSAGSELLGCLIAADISMDIDLDDNNGNTALDAFRYCTYEDPADLPAYWRSPSEEEIELFEKLLRTVRDRYLSSEIEKLLVIIELIETGNTNDAKQQLTELLETNELYRKAEAVETFRVIRDVQIGQGMHDAAVEALQEIIDLQKETMFQSPFEKSSKFDWMKS
jgi:hypothetical protein